MAWRNEKEIAVFSHCDERDRPFSPGKPADGTAYEFYLGYLPAGIYFLRITINHINQLMKVVVR